MRKGGVSLDWSGEKLFRVGFFVELGLVAVAALLGLIFKGSPFPFAIRLDGLGLAWGLAASVPAALLALLFTSETGRRIPGIGGIHERMREILDRPLRELGLLEVLLLSAAAGIGEEVLFRGIIQGLAGLWITSLVFGALHALTPTYFVLAAGIGLYLGWLNQASGNLLAPILVHSLYDAAALWLLRREFRREAVEEAEREAQEKAGEEAGAGAWDRPESQPEAGAEQETEEEDTEEEREAGRGSDQGEAAPAEKGGEEARPPEAEG